MLNEEYIINKKAVQSQRWPHNASCTWVSWKISGLPDYIRLRILFPTFFMDFCSDRPYMNVPTKSEVRIALPVPEIRGLAKLQTPQSRGRGGHKGSGMVPFERAFVSSYRPSIVTFPPSLYPRFRDIAAFVLHNAIFPTPLLVPPQKKFPMFPWE